MDTINDGWVSLHRKLLDNPIFKNPEALQLFIYSLLRANYKPREILMNHQVVFLDRGQFLFGLNQASKDLKMSIKKLRNRSKILEKLGIWARRRASKFSIITVCNYDYYQNPENAKGHDKGQSKGTMRATDNKEIKINNIRSGQKTPDPTTKDFLNYWSETFIQETGQPYTFSYGKEGKLIKTLLKTHDFESLQNLTKAFFKDEQCKRRGLTIGIFFQEINRLLSQKAMDPLEMARREMAQRGETRLATERSTPKSPRGNPVDRVEEILRDGGLNEINH